MSNIKRACLSLLAVMLSVMLLLAAGCAKKETSLPEAGSKVQEESRQNQEKVKLTLYFGNKDATGVTPEVREVVKDKRTPEQVIIEELIKGPARGLSRTIPEGTKLRSVTVKNGTAKVDFSREVQANHWGGTAGEAMTIDSVVVSLTELNYINKVQFLVEGKKEEAIWGHADTTVPFSRNPAMIKK